MSNALSGKEKYESFNTLSCLAISLISKYTTIDLRNETYLTGQIQDVDGFMNVTLKDVALYETSDKYRYFPTMFIQARSIRAIHIPDNINIEEAIKKTLKVGSHKKPDKRNFKTARAVKNQKETLQYISQERNKNYGNPHHSNKGRGRF